MGPPRTPPRNSPGGVPHYPGAGFRMGDYTIQGVLGQGAMATVYLATDSGGEEVALKVMVEGAGVSATVLERFRREAEASKKLRRHPNILTVYTSGREGPYHYIAMENIQRSKTLESALESTAISMADVVLIVIKIAHALHYAHSRRVLHRDIKPSNILIDEFGEPLLSDFGVASLIDLPSCTVTGALTGTPLYMSPEQARFEKAGPASDIYSLGVVLYEALTGVLPYHVVHGSPTRAALKAVMEEEPRRPRLFRKDISPNLEAVILNTLEKSPKDRYPDAAAFAVDLERALMNRPVSVRHFSVFDHVRHGLQRHRHAVLAGTAVVVLLAGFIFYYQRQLDDLRFASLLHYARYQDMAFQLEGVTRDTSQEALLQGAAMRDIGLAHTAMRNEDWRGAARLLHAARHTSKVQQDIQTAAIAELALARCTLMQGNRAGAMQRYHQIVQDKRTPSSIRAGALQESLILAQLEGQNETATRLFQDVPVAREDPIAPLILCLGNALSPQELLSRIPSLPARHRHAAYLVLGVRHYVDGHQSRSVRALQTGLAQAGPTMDWPAPFMRVVLSEVQPL